MSRLGGGADDNRGRLRGGEAGHDEEDAHRGVVPREREGEGRDQVRLLLEAGRKRGARPRDGEADYHEYERAPSLYTYIKAHTQRGQKR